MQRYWQPVVVVLIALLVGCHSRPATVAISGEVTFGGRAIEKGKIDFLPADNTPGASAVATIAGGKYEIPAQWGPRPDGVYLVRIVAYAKTGKKEPMRGIAGGGMVDVEENYIPAIYNSESRLKLRVADVPDKSKADFQLN